VEVIGSQCWQDFTIVLAAERQGVPPDVKLDGMYKFMEPWHPWQGSCPINNKCGWREIPSKWRFTGKIIYK